MKKRKWIWIGLAVILVVSVLLLSNPQVRTNLFVWLYHDDIEEGLRMNAGVPADDVVLFRYKYVNTWEGEHSMVEFLITPEGIPITAAIIRRMMFPWHSKTRKLS